MTAESGRHYEARIQMARQKGMSLPLLADEKAGLSSREPQWHTRQRKGQRFVFTKLALAAVTIGLFLFTKTGQRYIQWQVKQSLHSQATSLWDSAALHQHIIEGEEEICPQVEPWAPTEKDTAALPATPARETLAKLLSGAVQVDTSVYDDFPLPRERDPALWERVYRPFQRYLENAFPEMHNTPDKITRELVNEHGLLYTWQGKNKDLKPIIFMAHQDVVPVEPTTVDMWTHAPFSGYIDLDKDLVFGRGASDDKASLITLMTSVTSLLKSGFEPDRTIILSLGFDEEASGTQGARRLARRLGEIYGSHHEGRGAYMVVDEGSGLDADSYGIPMAGPSVAEKGYVDIRVTVNTPGGHSSQPPKHTSIGLLSRAIAAIEDHPWQPTLAIREDKHGDGQDNPSLETLLCVYDAPKMRHTPIGKSVHRFVTARKRAGRMSLKASDGRRLRASKVILGKRAKRDLMRARESLLAAIAVSSDAYQFTTTQAVDIISGGVKINALPERAVALVNHRINVEQSVTDVHEHIARAVRPIAQKYNLKMQAWGSDVKMCGDDALSTQGKAGTLVLEDAFDSPLASAPRTPTRGEEAAPYRLLSSVIRHTWNGSTAGAKKSSADVMATLPHSQAVRVAPFTMTGNTDTQSYWNLTRHIFRFAPNTLEPLRDPTIHAGQGVHTVDEVVQIDTLSVAFQFYTSMMVAAQHSQDS